MNKKISLCPIHPKYQAKRKPQIDCVYCWHRWLRTEKSEAADLYIYLAQYKKYIERFERTDV